MQNNQAILGPDSMIYTTKKRSPLWYILMSLLMFLYIYEFNFDAFGLSTYLTSRRVVLVVLFVSAFIKRNKAKLPRGVATKTLKSVSVLHVFLLFYALVLIVLFGRGVGSNVIDSIIRLFLFGLAPVWCFYQLFDNVEGFLNVILIATIIQAFFIVTSLIFPAFGELLDVTFSSEEAYYYRSSHRDGYAGGLACITAQGCLRFSMGLISSYYLAIKKNSPLFILLFVVLSVIAAMVARTGMFIGLIGLLMISLRQGSNNFLKLVFSFVVVALVIAFFTSNVDVLSFFDFHRMENLLYGNGGEAFIEDYFHDDMTYIPPLTVERVFLGTGIVSGVSGTGIKVNVDGGFLKIYAAYGLIICVLFYIIMFKNFLMNVKASTNSLIKSTILFFTIIILIGELKEYTIYQQYMVCLFFSLATLAYKPLKN